MALDKNLNPGDLEVQIKFKLRDMRSQMITDGTLDGTDYPGIQGGLHEVCFTLNDIFDQFVVDTALTTYTNHKLANSWRELRDIAQANFEAIDAIINP